MLATGLAAGNVYGQGPGPFLRVGPFDFDAQTRLEGVYTTNVEQERKSEATADRQDWYLVWGLDLKSTANFLPRTTFTVDAGIAIENHGNRPDLNNSENPFGRISIQFLTDRSPLTLDGGISYESTSESVDDKFIPKGMGFSTKKRQVGTQLDYGLGANWQGERLRLGARYDMLKERYESVYFFEEEQNEQTITYDAGLKLGFIRGINVGVTYQIEYTETDLINVEGGFTDETTDTITLDFDSTQELLAHPQLSYKVGLQREYEDGETEGWELIQTFTLSDDYDISPVLNLKGSVTYEWEEKPEEDDMTLTFDLALTHEISRRAQQKLTATRSPVDTFGTNLDTDETAFTYGLNIGDFFVPNIAFNFSAGYTIDRPVDGEEERTKDASVGLAHSVPINARLTRTLRYEYTVEDASSEDELLDEHRVTLSFVFQL